MCGWLFICMFGRFASENNVIFLKQCLSDLLALYSEWAFTAALYVLLPIQRPFRTLPHTLPLAKVHFPFSMQSAVLPKWLPSGFYDYEPMPMYGTVEILNQPFSAFLLRLLHRILTPTRAVTNTSKINISKKAHWSLPVTICLSLSRSLVPHSACVCVSLSLRTCCWLVRWRALQWSWQTLA